jgi:hypothetical protein
LIISALIGVPFDKLRTGIGGSKVRRHLLRNPASPSGRRGILSSI